MFRIPPFVKLLEVAEQEFGFEPAGELQRIPSLKQIGHKYRGLPSWLGVRVPLKGKWQGQVRTFREVDT